MRWLAVLIVLAALGGGAYLFYLNGLPQVASTSGDGAAPELIAVPKALAQQPAPAPVAPPAMPLSRQSVATPVVVVPDGRLTPIHLQQVPSMREGKILFLATIARDGKPGETPPGARDGDYFPEEVLQLIVQRTPKDVVPPAEVVTIPSEDNKEVRTFSLYKKTDTIEPGKVKLWPHKVMFRKLREGLEVRKGDLLAILDPSLAIDDLWIKVAKLDAADADRVASIKTRDETRERYLTAEKLWAKGAIPQEEYRAAKLTWDRYIYETVSKEQQVRVSANELRQSNTVLEQHAIRSDISGTVKRVLKKPGESVRNLETVLELQDNRRLRIEGRLDYHHRRHLKPGDRVFVEPTQSISPDQALIGHTQEITGVAVTRAGEIVSCSEDRTARVWDLKAGYERLMLTHTVGVKAVACAPKANQCATAAADGVVRLWDLTGDGRAPAQELRDGHKGSVSCLAFSPDGTLLASGGEDRSVSLWQVEGGKHLKKVENAHRGHVTSVQFVSLGEKTCLATAGRDYAMFIWEVSADGTLTKINEHLGRRSGDVPSLGANAAGGQVLFDQGKELRILSAKDGSLAGVLTSSGSNFTTMAQFSPDGKLVLTAAAGGSDGRLQLWRAPTKETRGYELRQLAWAGDPVSCGAFAPDGSFVVTGTRDRSVLVWPVPSKQEVETLFTAEVTLVDNDLDLNSRQVRIHAEIDNRWFELKPDSLAHLRSESVPGVDMAAASERLKPLVGKEFASEKDFKAEVANLFRPEDLARVQDAILRNAEKAGPLLPGNTATLVVYPRK